MKIYSWIDGIWQWIAERVFIRFDFDLPLQKLKLADPSKIILTLTHVGIIEFLILTSWCRKQGLPGISVANRKRILLLAKPAFFFQVLFRRVTYSQLFLSDEPGPRLLFCPIHERTKLHDSVPVERLLSELYSAESVVEGRQSFHFFPVFVMWRKHVRGGGRNPSEYLLGLGSDPNLIGKIWYLIRQRKDSLVKLLVEFPMPSQIDGTDNSEDGEPMRLARQIRRRIIVQTHQEMRIILGPRYSSPENVKEAILRDADMQSLIGEISVRDQVDRKKVMSRVYLNLTEIVSNYRYRTIELMHFFLRWFFNKVFDGVSIRKDQIHMVRDQMKNKPVVFVSCHRSHLDYLVVPYILFENGMVTPHIAAGINLSFWPFGAIARSAGAFFIRRSFRGDILYSACLRKYIEYLLKHRYNIKFFIEGTRSRSGKMLPPAYGILKMVAETHQRKAVDDISYVPVSITYDEVPEESAYTREIIGGQKNKENARELLKSLDIVKRNFGKVYVRFGNVVSAKQVERVAAEVGDDATLSLQKSAFQLCKNINDSIPVTPKSIVSSVFLGNSDLSLSLEEILEHSTLMADYVAFAGRELSVGDTHQFRRAVEQTVRRLVKAGVLQLNETVVPRRYVCERRKRALLALYKNNAIHCFIIPSIALLGFFEVAVRQDPSTKVALIIDQWIAACYELRNSLKFDFFFGSRSTFQKEVEAALGFIFGVPYLEKTVFECITSFQSERISRTDDFMMLCRLAEDLFESYLTSALFVQEHPASRWERKALLQRLPRFGEVLFQRGEILLPESLSVQSYANAVQLLENLKCLRNVDEAGKKLIIFESDGSALAQLMNSCREYLKLIRVGIPHYLKQHQTPTLAELHFSP